MGGLNGQLPKPGCHFTMKEAVLPVKGNPLERHADQTSFRVMEVSP